MSDIFANEEQDYSLDVPKEKRFLNTTSYDYSVEYLFNLIKKGKIVLEVPFQRKHIWKAYRHWLYMTFDGLHNMRKSIIIGTIIN